MAANMAGATLFLESEATEERLRSLPEEFRMLYFATHGVLKKQDPLSSSILLAETPGIDGTTHDGYVTVEELFSEFASKLNCDLAILSACHTNEGEPSPASGDDIATLSRGFMVAGARSVMATLWEACDGTFPTIMEAYLHARLQRSEPKDKALVSAIRKFLADNDFPVWRHPHFWASPVLIGSPD
jgi:CHAT domain-containing protein